jgi:hypothetical protein
MKYILPYNKTTYNYSGTVTYKPKIIFFSEISHVCFQTFLYNYFLFCNSGSLHMWSSSKLQIPRSKNAMVVLDCYSSFGNTVLWVLRLFRWYSEFVGPDLTLRDPVRPPRAHDRKGPIFYAFAYKYYCFGLIFCREKMHMGLSED